MTTKKMTDVEGSGRQRATSAITSVVSTPRLRVGFVLTPRFTLTAFAGFIDALRLAADEGDRSRQIVTPGMAWLERLVIPQRRTRG